jgi:His-Xaa-Ser system radical SAM maturase HxsC
MCTYSPNSPDFNLNIREIEKIVVTCPRNITKVVVSGGEPTIRKDILDVLKLIKQNLPNPELYMLTNGRMFFYPDFTKKFVETGCDSLAIPIHGHNPKLHDKISGVRGSFSQTVQGIKNLLVYRDRVRIEIRVVIHKLNYRQLPKICEFITREFKGIWKVVLFPIDIIGSANLNRKRLIVRITDVKPFLEKGINILEENGFEFQLFHLPFCIIDKKYWKNIAGRTVEGRRITFESCDGCVMKEKCPGIWKTYTFRLGTKEFRPITHEGRITTKSNI